MSRSSPHRPLVNPKLERKKKAPRVRRLKPRGRPAHIIDRPALHQYLWERTDEHGMVRIHQANLAEALGVSANTISRTLAAFCESGRALRVRFELRGIGIYHIADPATWRPRKEETWADGKVRRTIKWG